MAKIAMICAFPPPVSGQSLAAELLKDGLAKAGIPFFELNLAEPIESKGLLSRVWQLAIVEGKLAVLCVKHRDLIVYLQLGHGKNALIRDLFFLLTAKTFGKPCYAHVHGSGFRKVFDSLPSPVRFIEKKLIRQLNAAIVLSESLRKMFDELLENERVFAVDNGIDEGFVRLTDEPFVARHGEVLNVLFLSNFLTAKGFSVLLRTAALAEKNHCPLHFTFVGAKIPGQDVDIDDFIHDYELENVTVSDVVMGKAKHEMYRNADVFILPSVYEGQPLCILEAMFESLPVVTSKVGGIPEIFSDETGVRYVDPKSPEQILDVLCQLEGNRELLAEMGKANRELALNRFTAKRHVARMLEIMGF